MSPSSDGIFHPNKFLACVVMSQEAKKQGLERMGHLHQQGMLKMKKLPFFLQNIKVFLDFPVDLRSGNDMCDLTLKRNFRKLVTKIL